MWQRDRTVRGPERPGPHEIDALNRLFSEAFTDRYRQDGLAGVRVPFLNPVVWEYAIAGAGEGAMVWRDGRGDLIAFLMAHCSGTEGWMGPLAVRPDRQGEGLGREILRAGMAWLKASGARSIGLETMPRTMENIGFYAALGFVPGHLTITMQRRAPRRRGPLTSRLSELGGTHRSAAIAECRALASRIAPGVDFTREIETTLALRLGDITLLRGADGVLQAFALWHTAALAQGRTTEETRVLKLVAPDVPCAVELLAAVERETAALGLAIVSVRCQGAQQELFTALVAEEYRVHWTDLRLTHGDAPEVTPAGVLLSNWEI